MPSRHALHYALMGWREKFIGAVMGARGIRVLLGVLLSVVAIKLALDASVVGFRLRCWDTMLLSGSLVFALAVSLALSLPRRLDHALSELRIQGALPVTVAQSEEIKAELDQSGMRRVRRAAIVVGTLVLVAFLYVLVPPLRAMWQDPASSPGVVYIVTGFFGFLTLVCAFCGFVGGAFLGRVASYGSLARQLSRPNSGLVLQPGHYDGANGLAPVGSFYLYQALLTMFPILWLAVWWLIIPYYDTTGCEMGTSNPYIDWRTPLLILWLVSALFLYLAFVRPVLQLKATIKTARSQLERERMPEIRSEIDTIRARLAAGSLDDAARVAAEQRLGELAREHWNIAHMPAWPMDRSTMRQYFSVNAASTVAPLLLKGYDLARAPDWPAPDIMKIISG